jgi:hypothetical protein
MSDRNPSPHRATTDPLPTWVTPHGIAPTTNELHSVVLIDVAGSASRDSHALRRMRDDLYSLVADVVDDNDVDLDRLPFDDIGDGLRLMVPTDLIRPTRVVDVFVFGLLAGLREHRRYVSPRARIRLRVCFDLGLVRAHRRSWTGYPLVRAARLIEAEDARKALRANPEIDLVAVVSDEMFESVVRHRFGHISPESYQEIRVRVKEFDGRAWLLAPGSTVDAGPLPADRPAVPGPRRPGLMGQLWRHARRQS